MKSYIFIWAAVVIPVFIYTALSTPGWTKVGVIIAGAYSGISLVAHWLLYGVRKTGGTT